MGALMREVKRSSIVGFFLNSRFASTIFLATVVGVTTGFAVVGFVKLIDALQILFFEGGQRLLSFLGQYYVILIPAFGALFVGPLVVKFAPEAKGHGVPEVMKAIAVRGGKIRPVVVLVKALASALAIGSGASVGREGPIVQVGSALGSTLGQWFRQNESRIKNLIACGAAAGIAGVFNAPIAGMMFAVEVILHDFGVRALSSVVIAAVSSSIISQIYLGDTPAFVAPTYTLWSPYEIFLYVILGVGCGFVALFFMYVLHKSEDIFQAWKFPAWLKPAAGGLLLGAMGFFFPQVFGTGFQTIEDALHGNLGLSLLVGLVLLKIVATSLTLGSGNSGGVFAPALFIGAVFGGAFGKIVHKLPFPIAPPGAYALVGMASVFAGAAHAPVTAILIVFEMTGDYKLILPLMISAVVATAVSQVFHRDSIYTAKLKRSGIDVGALEETRMFGGLFVRDAMDSDFKIVPVDLPIRDVAEKISNSRDKTFFTADRDGELAGEIVLQDLEGLLGDLSLAAVLADDISQPIRETCYPDDSLSGVAKTLLTQELPHIVVVDPFDQNRVVGVLRRENVFKTYTQAASRREELLRRASQSKSILEGELQEVNFVVTKESQIIGEKIQNLGLPKDAVLISIERDAHKLIPRGGTVIKENDRVRAVFAIEDKALFQRWLVQSKITNYWLISS